MTDPEWLPAERLGQLEVDAKLRPWLIGKGLLVERVTGGCGERFSARLVEQWSGLLVARAQWSLQDR